MTRAGLLAALAALALAALATACGGGEEEVALRDDLHATHRKVTIAQGRSNPIQFEVGPDASSVLIEVRGIRGQFDAAELITPSGADAVSAGMFSTRSSRAVDGLTDWLYPNVPTVQIEPGTYSLVISGKSRGGAVIDGEQVDVSIYEVAAKSPPTCGIHLDFLVDRDAVDTDDFELATDLMVGRIDRLYRQIGVAVVDYQLQQVDLRAPDIDLGAQSAVEVIGDVLGQARRENAAGESAARDQSLHILVARRVGGAGDLDFDPAGYSMGLPGPYDADRPTAAVIVSTEHYVDGQNLLDAESLASSLAHELGHFLGLHHTSEVSGDNHDLIEDTPECTEQFGCDGDFLRNVMTSGAWLTGPPGTRTRFTAQQGEIIRRHPLCVPMEVEVLPEPPPPGEEQPCAEICTTPAVCARFDGAESCEVACDPTAEAPCAEGSCATDDRGTFVCQ